MVSSSCSEFFSTVKMTNRCLVVHSRITLGQLLGRFCYSHWNISGESKKSTLCLVCWRFSTWWNSTNHRWRYSNYKDSWNLCWFHCSWELDRFIRMSNRIKHWFYGTNLISMRNKTYLKEKIIIKGSKNVIINNNFSSLIVWTYSNII